MSGRLDSDLENIDSLSLNTFPSKRKLNIKNLIRIEHAIYAIGSNGSIYTNTRLGTKWYGKWRNPDHCIEALEKLGLITKKEAKQHLDYVKDSKEKSDREYFADAIIANAKQLGLKLTKTQEKKLQQIKEMRYG